MKTAEEILIKIDSYIEETHSKYTRTEDEKGLAMLDSQLQAFYKMKEFITEEEIG